jgi:hypothetical protein
MTLAERLSEFVRAAFTGLWVQSFEHDDATVEVARLCRQQGWNLATWDIDRGLSAVAARPEDSGTVDYPVFEVKVPTLDPFMRAGIRRQYGGVPPI